MNNGINCLQLPANDSEPTLAAVFECLFSPPSDGNADHGRYIS
jgi:hypothetical protein